MACGNFFMWTIHSSTLFPAQNIHKDRKDDEKMRKNIRPFLDIVGQQIGQIKFIINIINIFDNYLQNDFCIDCCISRLYTSIG